MIVRDNMRIDSSQPTQNTNDTQQVNRRQEKKVEQAPAQDTAQISEHARVQEALSRTPEIRQERVAAIKQQIEAGTYKVTDSQLADSMVKDMTNK
jgi:negative regulator of flagellin synthesis FlgM